MTDITELALITKIKNQLKNFDTVVLREAEANALVESLEKAQRTQTCEHSMFWDASGVKRCSKCDLPEHANVHYADAAEMEIAALRQRIAELEESNAQVIQSRDHYKRMTEEGLKQSDVVSVKLPEGFYPDGDIDCPLVVELDDVKEMLAAAGIKWEAE